MDKNTIIGFLLIAAIVIGFTWLSKPSEEEIAQRKRYTDSIALVQQQQQLAQLVQDSAKQQLAATDSAMLQSDSTAVAQKSDAYGDFSASAFGEEKFITLENDVLKLILSNKGGRIYSAELKNYKAQNNKPLILFDKDESRFNFVLTTNNNRVVNSSELYFEQQGETMKDSAGNQIMTLRLKTNNPNAYIDFIYTMPANDTW